MSRFRNMPFGRKLRLSMLLTSSVALLVACSTILTAEYLNSRAGLRHMVQTMAQVIAENSSAALAFADPAAAQETLQALRAEPQIAAAAIYDARGQAFASYQRDTRFLPLELSDVSARVEIREGFIIGFQPIQEGDRQLGVLYLQASMSQMRRQMLAFGLLTLLILMGSFVLAGVLSSFLQRTLARPILELVKTTTAITARQDWSLRARQYGQDELGLLTGAFNSMLERTGEAVSALRESEQQLRVVTDNAPVSLARLDLDLRFRFVNLPNAQRLGCEPEQLIGRRVSDCMTAESFERAEPYMRRACRGEVVSFEMEVLYTQQGGRWVSVNYVPEHDEGGHVRGFVAVIADITERKVVEEEIARARDEAVAASRAKDDFLAALSHELRTPLNPILLLASARARQRTLEPGVRDDFDTIRHNVELEARLIDDLLDLTRITRGKMALTRRPLQLHEVLRNALDAVRPDMAEKELHLAFQDEAAEGLVDGDAVRLQQVFWNVLKNSVKFTPAGGSITLSARNLRNPARIEVAVRDTGIGMTRNELERVFNAFSQGDHAEGGGSHRFGGLGLGLAIARMLVELHGGRIHASSAGLGQGVTMTVELPLATPAVEDPPGAAPAAPEAPAPALGADAPARRILLVEDHGPTRKAVMSLLGAHGYAISGASTYSEALRLAEASPPFDLLISDIGLPDGDGCRLMRELRKRFPDLKGVALSGYGMQDDVERSRQAGFVTHLTKPISVADLEETIPALLKS